jgi:hypothetical protein
VISTKQVTSRYIDLYDKSKCVNHPERTPWCFHEADMKSCIFVQCRVASRCGRDNAQDWRNGNKLVFNAKELGI